MDKIGGGLYVARVKNGCVSRRDEKKLIRHDTILYIATLCIAVETAGAIIFSHSAPPFLRCIDSGRGFHFFNFRPARWVNILWHCEASLLQRREATMYGRRVILFVFITVLTLLSVDPWFVSAAKAAPAEATRDCKDCPEMLTIPAGQFDMGSIAASAYTDEKERRTVTFAKPFAIGKYEVTFAEWDACVADGGCAHKPSDQGWGRDRRPVTNVSWDDVQTYVAWLSKKTGKKYRLPTEAEWEYAARAGTATDYFWGDDVGTGKAQCKGCGGKGEVGTTPVGGFEPNAFGLHDTVGNVREWVQDCYLYEYGKAPKDGSAATEKDCQLRTLRGGSWNDQPRDVRSTYRYKANPWNSYALLGFRVAKTLP